MKTVYQSPLGLIQIDAEANRLQALTFLPAGASQTGFGNSAKILQIPGFELVSQLERELDAYFSGDLQQFSIEIDWDIFSGFQKDVLALTATIPYGTVWSYGELARKLGKPGAARAVGHALGANQLPIIIPCHRVIGSDKRLHGYAGGLEAKTFLLNLEGLQVEGDRVMNKS